MVNSLWSILIIIGIIFSFSTGNISELNKEILNSGTSTLDLLLVTIPLLIIWMGILNIADQSGLLEKMARLLRKIIKPLFPKVKNNKALSYICSNIIANAIGLGSAATPFGLKAMQELQKENPDKKRASSAMITFLIINTSGVTIIPTTVIAMRLSYGSIQPTKIIFTSIISTFIASLVGLLIDYFIRRKNHDN